MPNAIVLHPFDNVATALQPLKPGDVAEMDNGKTVTLTDNVPRWHKFALCDIIPGADVVKYGESIGVAVTGIAAGRHVHVHNVESKRGRGDLEAK